MPTQITALPTPPSRAVPSTFSTLADAFLGALPTFTTEANALATEVNANKVATNNSEQAASASAGYAATQAVLAQTAATDAVLNANAVQWVSGTTYAMGDVVWSSVDMFLYRRKTAGAGTTQPPSDTTNWKVISYDAAAVAADIASKANLAGSSTQAFATAALTATGAISAAGTTGVLVISGTGTDVVATVAASGGGDVFRIIPKNAGGGVKLDSTNAAQVSLAPIELKGSTITLTGNTSVTGAISATTTISAASMSVSADPTTALQLATKQYVDNKADVATQLFALLGL